MKEAFIPLFLAHVLGDFLLQPDWMAGEAKRRIRVLLAHAALHGLLVLLLCPGWMWQPAAMVFLAHALIDFFKAHYGWGTRAFLLDQVAHLLVLAVLAMMLDIVFRIEVPLVDAMILAAGLVSAVWGVGHFIRCVADGLCVDNPDLKRALDQGLKNGGAMIGKLERAMIFLLVFMGQPGGVGFLIAAKSILRFEEAKKQPLAEYVLIGTLWSFGLALAIAAGTRYLVVGP